VSTVRPFSILGIQQIAVGGADKQKLRSFWVDLLGLEYRSTFVSESENVDEDICQMGSGAFAVEVDLMQPLDPEKRPRVDNPALNHVGLWVDNLAVAVDWLSAQGLRFAPGGIRKGAGGHDVCFVHPKGSDEFPRSAEGVLVELVQAPQAVIVPTKCWPTQANSKLLLGCFVCAEHPIFSREFRKRKIGSALEKNIYSLHFNDILFIHTVYLHYYVLRRASLCHQLQLFARRFASPRACAKSCRARLSGIGYYR
jgi:lactoylglutathione lyase